MRMLLYMLYILYSCLFYYLFLRHIYFLFRWIETWLRKRRQFYNNDYTIEIIRDIACANQQNKSLLNILKENIECGWGNFAYKNVHNINIIIFSFIVAFITSFN